MYVAIQHPFHQIYKSSESIMQTLHNIVHTSYIALYRCNISFNVKHQREYHEMVIKSTK